MQDDIYAVIGNRIREIRKAGGYSQQDVAEQLGLTSAGYGLLELGRRQISIDYLFKLSRILSTPLTRFLGIPSELSPDEDELLTAYRIINDEAIKTAALLTVKGLASAQAKAKPERTGQSKRDRFSAVESS